MDWDADQKQRDLALSAIPSAWASLDGAKRDDIIDLLSTFDHVLALRCLVQARSLDAAIASQIRAALADVDRQRVAS